MQPLKKRASELSIRIQSAYDSLNIDAMAAEQTVLDAQLSEANVWANPEHAQQLAKKSSDIKNQVDPWQRLLVQIHDIVELIGMGDDSLAGEFTNQLDAIEQEYELRQQDLLFNGQFDNHNAILKLSAGAGGTDAQDWTQMLERMYLRWAEHSRFDVQMLERSVADEAGIKSATYLIKGTHAYGRLKSEHGVHRLVRLSPFNSDNLRQTSFALVEAMPEIDAPDEVVLDESDIKIDVYRAGGHGGQSVNTTDSAVRVTHIPTGIVVSIQNERSQLQNKETALKILKGKLAQLQLEQHADTLADLRAGESASWGAQIRNYVLHPYTMVKDTRTKHEDRDAQGVLDGKLDEFMRAYLEAEASLTTS